MVPRDLAVSWPASLSLPLLGRGMLQESFISGHGRYSCSAMSDTMPKLYLSPKLGACLLTLGDLLTHPLVLKGLMRT